MIHKFKGWESFSLFFSAEYTQSYLKTCYQKQNLDQPEQKSFENCYAFIYYLEHGSIYYQQASKSPLILQPILLFYGLVHLIKACILTRDPGYPDTTTVLAHGVSTRKRKKQNYQFFLDEVKFQKHGLFPYMSDKLFHMKQLEGDKVSMEDLLRSVPELDDLFWQMEGRQNFLKLAEDEGGLVIPERILDLYHMTENRFKDFISSATGLSISESSGLILKKELPESCLNRSTLLKENFEDNCFVLPIQKTGHSLFPELISHYLLLYNLGMIARYETEWWSEVTKMMPNRDFPFIKSFLGITLEKSPYLIYSSLKNNLKA